MFVTPLFRDRVEAGRILSRRLESAANKNPLVLAIPRGGVPVGFEIAQALHADFDIFLVRKLGVPGEEEMAMGAIASGGVRVLNDTLIKRLRISPLAVERITAWERQEIERRERTYRHGRPGISIANRAAILVDDGLATGASMLAAVRGVRAKHPESITVAAPVASREAFEELSLEADNVVCIEMPEPFYAVGPWYQYFPQTSDAEVCDLLHRAQAFNRNTALS